MLVCVSACVRVRACVCACVRLSVCALFHAYLRAPDMHFNPIPHPPFPSDYGAALPVRLLSKGALGLGHACLREMQVHELSTH